MKDEIVAKRYADAFLKYARSTCGQEKAISDFKNIKEALTENPQLSEFLESPAIAFSEKKVFIERLLSEGFSDEFGQFLKLLLRKGRIDKLTDISEYIRVTYAHGQRTQALLKTSFPLELELIGLIVERLERKFKKKIKLYIELDGNLLGGIKVIIGNMVIDGSVRRRIDELRGNLEAIRTA